MTDALLPEDVEEEEVRGRNGCLDSWVLRITLGVFVVIGIGLLIAFITYMDTRADRSHPIEILHYPGITVVNENSFSAGQSRVEYRGTFENMGPSLLTDIEAHYQRQMDRCFRLSEDLNDPTVFHTVVCEKDRSHDWLGFTQFARVEIRPTRDEQANWTGEVVIIVDNQWEG